MNYKGHVQYNRIIVASPKTIKSLTIFNELYLVFHIVKIWMHIFEGVAFNADKCLI